jgi:hypothetical protein
MSRRRDGWDVFDPETGAVYVHVRWEWLARYLTHRGGLDYARPGEGWIR